jgi:hypothetical protein
VEKIWFKDENMIWNLWGKPNRYVENLWFKHNHHTSSVENSQLYPIYPWLPSGNTIELNKNPALKKRKNESFNENIDQFHWRDSSTAFVWIRKPIENTR